MQVTIDGVAYAPTCNSGSRIGIAITTHNRPAVLPKTIEQHLKHLPLGAKLIIIDDGSNPPAVLPESFEVIRHEKSLGIVASKNRSLEALIDAGCEHLFLWDDDAYPISDNWHVPYVESPEPHLAYQFLDLAGPNKLRDLGVLFRDGSHIAYTGQPAIPDPLTWGGSLDLNVSLLSALAECNRDKADIRQIENSRSSQK